MVRRKDYERQKRARWLHKSAVLYAVLSIVLIVGGMIFHASDIYSNYELQNTLILAVTSIILASIHGVGGDIIKRL